ncbi:hypothetical protein SLA2020_412200 [Shorea laevis]
MIRKRKIQRSTVGEREIIQGGGVWTIALLVHPQNLQVLMVKRESPKDRSPGQREIRKRSTDREIRTLVIMKMVVQCRFQGFLRV